MFADQQTDCNPILDGTSIANDFLKSNDLISRIQDRYSAYQTLVSMKKDYQMSTATPKRTVSRKATPSTAKLVEGTSTDGQTRAKAAALVAPKQEPLAEPVTPAKVKEVRETPEEKEARLKADVAALGLTGEFKDAYSPAVRKAIVENIREQIADAPVVNGIQAGAVTWTKGLAMSLLRLMRGKGVQRPNFSWSQINDLALAMRTAINGESHETQWYDGTNLAVIAIDKDPEKSNFGIDSRHRNIARICATGTPLEIDEMLRIVMNHDEQPVDDQGIPNIDPVKLLTVPITGWIANDGVELKIEEPNWAFIVSIGCKREAFSVIDTAQRERTGADMLATYPESSRVLAETGIDAKTMETALGETYMRTNFTFETEDDGPTKGQTIIKPGSLKTGGKKGPNRYPVYSRLFGGVVDKDVYTPGLIAQAHGIIEATCKTRAQEVAVLPGVSFHKSRLQSIGYYHVLSVAALVVDAWSDADVAIADFVLGLCEDNPTALVDANGKKLPTPKTATPYVLLKKYLEPKEYMGKNVSKCFITTDGSKVVLKTAELYTAIVLAFTMTVDENDDPILFSQADFIKACSREYDYRIAGADENDATTGIDAIGLDKALVTDAEKAIYGKATQVRANKKAK
jgi:hypothetical protein